MHPLRALTAKYGANIASGFWLSGNALSASMVGWGGTWAESSGGGIMLAATGFSLLCGHMRFGFPISVSLAWLGLSVIQSSQLMAFVPLTWLGWTMTALATLPAATEPLTSPWAKTRHGKSCFLRLLANPRPFYGIVSGAGLLPLIVTDAVNGRYRMLPVYALLVMGSLTSMLSIPPQKKPVTRLAAS